MKEDFFETIMIRKDFFIPIFSILFISNAITVIRSLMVVIFIILFIMDSKQKNTIYKAKKKEFGNTKLIKAMNIVATLPLKNR